MGNTFGIESHGKHVDTSHRSNARYLIMIESAGSAVARLFTQQREQVAEFDASAEEVAVMTKELVPTQSALGLEWDSALEGRSAAERADARVYTLDV
jgi:hypothetical protein